MKNRWIRKSYEAGAAETTWSEDGGQKDDGVIATEILRQNRLLTVTKKKVELSSDPYFDHLTDLPAMPLRQPKSKSITRGYILENKSEYMST